MQLGSVHTRFASYNFKVTHCVCNCWLSDSILYILCRQIMISRYVILMIPMKMKAKEKCHTVAYMLIRGANFCKIYYNVSLPELLSYISQVCWCTLMKTAENWQHNNGITCSGYNLYQILWKFVTFRKQVTEYHYLSNYLVLPTIYM